MTTQISRTSISVVIPAYNAELSIKSTLKSVLDQEYNNYDVYIVDDGSTDNTISIVWKMREQFIKKGIKIHMIAINNSGVSIARNRGVAASSGKYIAFLDADDKWLPNKLNEHALMMDKNPDIGVSFAQVAFVNSNNKRYGALSASFEEPINVMDMLDSNPTISPSNWVVRRSAFDSVDGFKTQMSHAEDQDFIIRLIAKGDFKVSCLAQYLTQYMTSENGLSSNLDGMYKGWKYLSESIQATKFKVSATAYAQLKANYCWYLARRSWQVRSVPFNGLKYCWKALRADISTLRVEPLTKLKIITAVIVRVALPIRPTRVKQKSSAKALTTSTRKSSVSAEVGNA